MKKRSFLILSLTVVFVALAQAADNLRVTSVKGKITFMTNNGQRLPLEVNDIVDKSTIINMPFHGMLELLDQSSKKRYTINVPGRAPISALLRDNRNSLENLTQQYVKTLVNEVTNNGKIKGNVVSEPAAITRKLAKVKESDGMELDLDMDMDMDMSLNMNFSQKDLINEYRQFRQQCTNTYTNWMREAWQSYTGEAPKKVPQVKDAPPVFIPVDENGEEGEPITYAVVYSGSYLNVINTRQLRLYDYRGTESASDAVLVYGWKLIGSTPTNSSPYLLLAPVLQTDTDGAFTELRLLHGKSDTRYSLPDSCVGAAIRGRRLYAFSSNSLYRADTGEQRFSALRLPVDGVVTDYLGITSNGTALLVCGSEVWAVSLP